MQIKNYFMTIATLARSHTWLLLDRAPCLSSLSCDMPSKSTLHRNSSYIPHVTSNDMPSESTLHRSTHSYKVQKKPTRFLESSNLYCFTIPLTFSFSYQFPLFSLSCGCDSRKNNSATGVHGTFCPKVHSLSTF